MHFGRVPFQMVDRQPREHVHGIGDDEDDRVLLQPRALERIENLLEERDVAVDQIQPALIRLAAQPGGDADQIRIRAFLVPAGVDLLIAGDAGAVEQIERFALGHLFVGIEDVDFADDAGALQRERRVDPTLSAAADDADFHSLNPVSHEARARGES